MRCQCEGEEVNDYELANKLDAIARYRHAGGIARIEWINRAWVIQYVEIDDLGQCFEIPGVKGKHVSLSKAVEQVCRQISAIEMKKAPHSEGPS